LRTNVTIKESEGQHTFFFPATLPGGFNTLSASRVTRRPHTRIRIWYLHLPLMLSNTPRE